MIRQTVGLLTVIAPLPLGMPKTVQGHNPCHVVTTHVAKHKPQLIENNGRDSRLRRE
ncbi:hypothetical protein IID62_09195 [candidate division KSB1 bacterium]|nr:hypothetical protein [candidate division KSB1 bacterium]